MSEMDAPLPGLTLLVLLLVPCLLLVLLLNCLLLGLKLLRLARGHKRESGGPEGHAGSRFSEGPSFACRSGKRIYVSASEPMLAPPVTSSLTSSAERAAACRRSVRPDGATCGGSGSLRVPSTFLAAVSTAGSHSIKPREWRRGAPVSDSDTDGGHAVPPNSPEVHAVDAGGRARLRRSSTLERLRSHFEMVSADRLHVECEVASSIPPEMTCLVASASSFVEGPGLDSDFGASAGEWRDALHFSASHVNAPASLCRL
ncbi:protein huluwa isoform X2 [Denticeps clupeoides]|uniref:protein huluwa isoform X2 n=1 Tax=Denticeps clupeoides TaxID=299321 RepID=UPI0010A41FD6|nr:protein huluwa-like isoform X2 [Denticeps clupeoides]